MTQNLTVRDLQGATLTGRSDRLSQEAMTEGTMVASASNHFKVVQQASPNMTVRVGSGIAGDVYVVPISGRGTYIVHNRTDTYIGSGNTDVPIANGDPTNPRIDGIDMRVRDNEFDSSGFNDATIVVTQGAPAGSPVAPAIPSGCVRLGTVAVATGLSTSIGTGLITDTRKVSSEWSNARGTVSYVQVVANQTGIGTGVTDLTSLTLTTTTVAGRRYRVSGKAQFIQGASAALCEVRLLADGTQIDSFDVVLAGGSGRQGVLLAVFQPSAAAHTYKLSALSDAGTSTLSAAAAFPAWIMIEDVGGY